MVDLPEPPPVTRAKRPLTEYDMTNGERITVYGRKNFEIRDKPFVFQCALVLAGPDPGIVHGLSRRAAEQAAKRFKAADPLAPR
jgi:hypothetical protein